VASCSLQPVMMRYMRPNHSYGRTLTIGIHWCSCAKLFELSSIDGEVGSHMRGREQASAAFGHGCSVLPAMILHQSHCYG
jgi:hypothetical protein